MSVSCVCLLAFLAMTAGTVARTADRFDDAFSPSWVDGTPILERLTQQLVWANDVPSAPRARLAPQQVVGERRSFFSFDFKRLRQFEEAATLRAVGEFCYVYVADDQWNVRVGQASVDKVVEAFDRETIADTRRGIYEIEVEAFGNPPDVDGDPKVVLLLMDIPDNFLPPSGSFVAGYFTSVNQHAGALTDPRYGIAFDSNETEMLYIDTDPLDPASTLGLGIFAHEFQHLIHYGFDQSEEVWVNEGLSDFAMFLCGYSPRVHVRRFEDQPGVSLTCWPGGVGTSLPYYGASYLWMVYLFEQYGGIDTIRRVIQSQETGTRGVSTAIQAAGFARSMEDIYADFRIAVIADSDRLEDGRYGFRNEQVSVVGRAHPSLPIPRQRRTIVGWGADVLEFEASMPDGEALQVDVSAADQWRDAFSVRAALFSGEELVEVRDLPRALLGPQFTDAFPEFGQDVTRIVLSVLFLPGTAESTSIEFNYTARLSTPIDFAVHAFRNPIQNDFLEVVVLADPPIDTGELTVRLAAANVSLQGTMTSVDDGATFGAAFRTPDSRAATEWAWGLVHFEDIVGLGTVRVAD